jgi:single-strand DNA-binding protein
MAGTVNKVILIGRLGKDPEVKYLPSGAPVAKFSLATDEVFKDRNGEQQQRTEWHRIVAWNKLAEICGQYLTKGKLVYIEGSIRSSQWEDQAGNKRTSYDIIASRMQMLGSKGEGLSGEPQEARRAAAAASDRVPESEAPPVQVERPAPTEAPPPAPEITDDDIPF